LNLRRILEIELKSKRRMVARNAPCADVPVANDNSYGQERATNGQLRTKFETSSGSGRKWNVKCRAALDVNDEGSRTSPRFKPQSVERGSRVTSGQCCWISANK
jgi:hypothetical protein